MQILTQIVCGILLLFLAGCYPGIKGIVLDDATGKPIEGAVILAQWTSTGGLPGLTHHHVYKIEEAETDAEGRFSVTGVYNPFVDQPEMVIYKKGYIPWRNDMDFFNKTWEHYERNIWKNNMIYRLALLPRDISLRQLDGFLSSGLMGMGVKYKDAIKDISKGAMYERNW